MVPGAGRGEGEEPWLFSLWQPPPLLPNVLIIRISLPSLCPESLESPPEFLEIRRLGFSEQTLWSVNHLKVSSQNAGILSVFIPGAAVRYLVQFWREPVIVWGCLPYDRCCVGLSKLPGNAS